MSSYLTGNGVCLHHKEKSVNVVYENVFDAKILQNAHIPSEVKHGSVIVGQVVGILISGL